MNVLRSLGLVLALLAALALLPAPTRAAQPPAEDVVAPENDILADPSVRVSVALLKDRVLPGDQIALAVIFDHAPNWHVNTNSPRELPGFKPMPTTVTLSGPGEAALPASVVVGPQQWPAGKEITVYFTGSPEKLEVLAGKAIVYVPIIVAADAAPGAVPISVKVEYQACDDRICLIPETLTFDKVLTVEPAGTVLPPRDASAAATFAGFDVTVFAKMLSGELKPAGKPIEFNVFGRSFTIDAAGAGLALLLLLAALGGFLLNLTPCVLPVIPIKILGLSAAAGNPRRCFYLGVVMSLGVVAFWLALGGAIAFIAGFKAINQLFQTPWFSLGVGAFIALMAVGMLGVFSLKLPNAVYLLDPKRESAAGSFMFGVLTAVLSTPCTAPFMGTAAAWAAKQPSPVTLATFAAIGLGMALPYLILAASPKLVEKVPRSGPASDLVKQVMGMLMLAVAAFFVGTGLDPMLRLPVDPPVRGHWWLVAALVIFAMVWMVARTFKITKSIVRRGFFSLVALLFCAASVVGARHFTDRGPIRWIGYTPERFEEARAAGKVVVVDFTAEWCLNCMALEAAVLFRPEVASVLNSEAVVPLKVDLTGDNKPGQEKLKALNWVGIPLLAIYGPGLPEPRKYDSYTVSTVLDAIDAARGTARGSGGGAGGGAVGSGR
ncbi:MAG: cytochrome c biogenesis protein CcdA [Planctomycetota bacterium]|nr:cytochrome c biogenesis protein CcdA [Planctomycetota bacterium]